MLNYEMDNNKFIFIKHTTWIIAYCPDTNSYFVTTERGWFWQDDKVFKMEQEAIDFFINNVEKYWKNADDIHMEESGSHITELYLEIIDSETYSINKKKGGGYDIKIIDDIL